MEIRKNYNAGLTDDLDLVRQMSTAIYFIDKLALRAGNEKGDDLADTVGCCSLRVENVTLTSPKTVNFDFLGKDSMRYQNSVEVPTKVFNNIKRFQKGKKPKDDLFDLLNVGFSKFLLINFLFFFSYFFGFSIFFDKFKFPFFDYFLKFLKYFGIYCTRHSSFNYFY